ncbi:MAG: Outer membrane porin F precursor [Candidatus Magnetoglobus multicellularis str. Araruama]|uniref:Outer membrane porin F n=1 Tax=Candidatus Magnetoglobus multicellularis str. Araruama TaxID=890399 RepID=A0A1V1PIJ8_9BACT|nr:MAG: Outer membrane porin F precursor [Candidatus Magnetoglobus multicellularis str. Araruama]
MNRFFSFTLAVCLLVLMSFTGVSAEVRPNGITITPYAGWYIFEGNEDYNDRPLYGLGLGYRFSKHWSTELSLSYGDFKLNACESPDCDDVSIDGYSAYMDIYYDIFPCWKVVPYATVGMGAMALDYDEEDRDPNLVISKKTASVFHYGGGLRYSLTPQLDVRADIRHALSFDVAKSQNQDFDLFNNMMATVGFTLTLGKSKPAVSQSQMDDQDQDGVPDSLDQCPNTVPMVSVNARGCPYDSDQDGVYDHQDKCPDTQPGERVDMFGCSKDSDSDGVMDALDRCPGTPANATVDVHGCPLDSDGDGISDLLDKCPNTPAGVNVDAAGCPQKKAEKKIRLNLKIEFASGKAEISTNSLDQVKKVAEAMQEYPDSTAVIEAHTDSSGGSEYNLKLSQQRANMVVHYLTNFFGIDASRLRAVGYGESRPVADNQTKAGRKRNRRAVAIITATQK